MGSETDDHTPPKLPLLISRPGKTPDMPTPTPETAVSVPFKWEEAPGKPRPCHNESKPQSTVTRTLELPPRLLFSEAKVSNAPSPTTVLDGPYVGRAMSFTTSYRSPRGVSKEQWSGGFGSSRWSSFRKNKEEFEGSSDFLNSSADGCGNDGNSKVKITRVRRRESFFSLSHTKINLWVSN